MKTIKQSFATAGTDHLAGLIAGKIILWQSVTAGKLNRVINRYPAARQKCLLWLFCALVMGGIAINLFLDNHLFTNQKKDIQTYQIRHIGQASNVPAPATKTNQLIHLKNDRYGK